jgi:hypothetical protein
MPSVTAQPPDDSNERPEYLDADERADGDEHTTHLDDVDAGAGCTEIWEYLSEQRDDE